MTRNRTGHHPEFCGNAGQFYKVDKSEAMADIINIYQCLEIFKALYAHRKPGLNCTVEISKISDIILGSGKWEETVLTF